DGKVALQGNTDTNHSFSATGRLATAGTDGAIHVWDATGDDPAPVATVPKSDLTGVKLFPRGDYVVRFGGRSFEVWALGPGEPKLVSRPPEAFADTLSYLAVLPDGGTIVAGHASGTVRFWTFTKGVLVERSPPKPQPV